MPTPNVPSLIINDMKPYSQTSCFDGIGFAKFKDDFSIRREEM